MCLHRSFFRHGGGLWIGLSGSPPPRNFKLVKVLVREMPVLVEHQWSPALSLPPLPDISRRAAASPP